MLGVDEENHIMMALLDHSLSSDDNTTFQESHLHWGDAETKFKLTTLSTSGFLLPDNGLSPNREKNKIKKYFTHYLVLRVVYWQYETKSTLLH